jgi:hypothetical protein
VTVITDNVSVTVITDNVAKSDRVRELERGGRAMHKMLPPDRKFVVEEVASAKCHANRRRNSYGCSRLDPDGPGRDNAEFPATD